MGQRKEGQLWSKTALLAVGPSLDLEHVIVWHLCFSASCTLGSLRV